MPADAASSVLSIPTIIWSGVVASLISLGGVVLSNRSSLERLKEQLRHDSSEKHKDRIFDLRKDVYLELVTQMTYVGGHLGSLAGKDPTTADLSGPLQMAMAELAKAQLVGSRETAALAAEMSAIYGEALFNLIAAAKPLHDLKIDIKISGEMYDQQFAQAQRVISEITAMNESGEKIQKEWRLYSDHSIIIEKITPNIQTKEIPRGKAITSKTSLFCRPFLRNWERYRRRKTICFMQSGQSTG